MSLCSSSSYDYDFSNPSYSFSSSSSTGYDVKKDKERSRRNNEDKEWQGYKKDGKGKAHYKSHETFETRSRTENPKVVELLETSYSSESSSDSETDFLEMYKNNEIDIPPYDEKGPTVLIIIDTNLDTEEYYEYQQQIKKIAKEVEIGKRDPSQYIMCFAMSDVDKTYDFCLRNVGVLRTYNGHRNKIRFLTNSNRASTCVGRGHDPKEAGQSFVRYVREDLKLDAPILVYYFINESCRKLANDKDYVFVTNKQNIAKPYILKGKFPKGKY